MPQASVSSGTAPSEETASTDDDRVADRGLDALDVGDDAGRGLGLRAEHDAGAALGDGRADLARHGHLAPGVVDALHVEAVVLADLDPALAERAGDDDRDPVARAGEVRDRRLHRTRAGRAEEQHLALGAEHLLEALERPRVDRLEVGAAVVDHRLGAGREHLGRHGRRARREQVALLHGTQASERRR